MGLLNATRPRRGARSAGLLQPPGGQAQAWDLNERISPLLLSPGIESQPLQAAAILDPGFEGPGDGASPGRGGGKPGPVICRGTAAYTAVGPDQAHGVGAFSGHGVHPDDGTVAIGPPGTIFGLDKAAMAKVAPHVVIQPDGLDWILKLDGGPAPPFSVGDVGDEHIRNSPITAFDLYRFKTLHGAKAFGAPKRMTTITLPQVPGARCPPDFVRIR